MKQLEAYVEIKIDLDKLEKLQLETNLHEIADAIRASKKLKSDIRVDIMSTH